MDFLNIENLTPDELTQLAAVVSDPCMWAEAVLRDPDSFDGKDYAPLKLNTVERLILSSKHRKNIIKVHRRSGKSYSIAIRALWRTLTHESSQFLIICPDQGKVKALFEVIAEFLRVSPGLDSSIENQTVTPAYIRFKNGSTIKGFTTGASAKRGGNNIRGMTADEVAVDEAAFLNEGNGDEGDDGDWKAITPIMYGDSDREVICWIASTPNANRGMYWKWCTEDTKDVTNPWNRIFMSVEDNPDFPENKRNEIKSDETESTWNCEWLTNFPDIGEGVFRNSYVDRAQHEYEYYSKLEVDNEGYTIPPGVRTMGVDFDKMQAGPSIVILEVDPINRCYKTVYSEEIPKADYSLTDATNRIIYLDSRFDCKHIYLDRGMGEMQLETLKLYGLQHPYTKLHTKVEGFTFSDRVPMLDPTGLVVSKPIKPVIINILVKWLEDNKYWFSSFDRRFVKQLNNYKILKVTSSSVIYSGGSEHFIDATCLAAYAIYKNITDPFAFVPATQAILMKVPEATTVEITGAGINIRVSYDDPGARVKRNFSASKKLPGLDFVSGRGKF